MSKRLFVVLIIVAFMMKYSYETAEMTRAALQMKVIAPQALVPYVVLGGFLGSLNTFNYLLDSYVKWWEKNLNNMFKNARKSQIRGLITCRGPTSSR